MPDTSILQSFRPGGFQTPDRKRLAQDPHSTAFYRSCGQCCQKREPESLGDGEELPAAQGSPGSRFRVWALLMLSTTLRR